MIDFSCCFAMLALLPPRVLGFKYAHLDWWDRLL